MRKSLLGLTLISLLAFTACGEKEKDPFENSDGKDGGGGKTAELTATVKGKITFEGEVPPAKAISTAADPNCKNPDLKSEETVVSDGGLENVILFVSGGDLAGKKFAKPTEVVELKQEGCHYIPHAITLQVNQTLNITNGDDTAHNLHAWSEVNPSFNEAQPSKGVMTQKKFAKEEILFPIRCDVHNWMNTFVGVFAHPLHTVSKKGGAYEMKLPAGHYEITAEHEKYGKKTMSVDVKDGESVDLNFTFKSSDKAAD